MEDLPEPYPPCPPPQLSCAAWRTFATRSGWLTSTVTAVSTGEQAEPGFTPRPRVPPTCCPFTRHAHSILACHRTTPLMAEFACSSCSATYMPPREFAQYISRPRMSPMLPPDAGMSFRSTCLPPARPSLRQRRGPCRLPAGGPPPPPRRMHGPLLPPLRSGLQTWWVAKCGHGGWQSVDMVGG